MLVIDYRGFRLLAVTLLPIDRSSIVYGTYDAGVSLHCDAEVGALFSKATRALNLKEHVVTDRAGTREQVIGGPIDIEMHRSPVDNK